MKNNQIIKRQDQAVNGEVKPDSVTELQRLTEELRTHQLELEMQNEELRRMQAKLIKSGEKYSNFYDLAPIGYITIDNEGAVVETNLKMAEILNANREKMLEGQALSQYIHPESQDNYYFFLKKLSNNKDLETCEVQMLRTDGSGFWAFIEAISLKNDESSQSHLVIRDISQRKQAEQELLEFQAGLEKRVLERTNELEKEISWHKKTSEALRQSEERFRNMFEQAPMGYQSLDCDGCFIDVNQAWLDMLGYDRKEVTGKCFGDFLVPEQKSAFLERFPLFKSLGRIRSEFSMCRKDGSIMQVAFEGRICYQPDGSFQQTHCILEDISERKRSEEEIRRSNEILTLFIKYSPIYAFIKEVTSETSRVLMASKNYVDMIGVKAKDMAGKTMQELFPADFAAKMTADDWAVVSGRKILRKEEELDGRFFSTIKFPIYQGEKKLLAGYTIDVTERKKIEKAIVASEQRYRGIVNLAVDGILLASKEGVIVEANERMYDILGMDNEDIIGRHISELPFTSESLNRNPLRLGFLNKNEVVIRERTLNRDDGSRVEVETRTKIMPDGTYQMVCCDITKRKQMQIALIQSERLSAIGVLSGGMIHNFNNSLQAIMGYLELIEISPDVPMGVKANVKIAKERALAAAADIRQLQRFTKKIKPERFYPFNLNDLIESIITQTKPLWKDNAEMTGLEITFQRDYGKIELVKGDQGELSNAFHNLIKNAIEAMPKGGVITVNTGILDDSVFVRVSDTGIGMDEETKKMIFEPFFTTKGSEKGTGLGMSTVYATVRDHDGRISVESEAGRGTTIEILFPRLKQAIVAEEPPLAVCSCPARILWVDDDEHIRVSGKSILEKMGHEADIASSAKEALSLLEKKKYDLLISDVAMPGMSGWKLADEIKDRYDGMKVAIVSGWGTYDAKQKMEKHGVSFVLGKPVGAQELGKLINDAASLKKNQ